MRICLLPRWMAACTTARVCAAQAGGMLADPKIARFTDSFPRQWLQLKRVGAFPPDPKLYPDYDDWLEQSMILETTHYFAEMFRKNLPLVEFLDSDWTMLNPRLRCTIVWNRRPVAASSASSCSPSSVAEAFSRRRPCYR